MRCTLLGAVAFAFCAFFGFVALSIVASRDNCTGVYKPKQLAIRVRVIDTDEHKPVPDARVSFFRTIAHPMEDAAKQFGEIRPDDEGQVTNVEGYVEVMGQFPSSSTRHTARNRKYHSWGCWLRGVAPRRPVAYVAVDGYFGGERDYDIDDPVEVLMIMNKATIP